MIVNYSCQMRRGWVKVVEGSLLTVLSLEPWRASANLVLMAALSGAPGRLTFMPCQWVMYVTEDLYMYNHS